MRNNPVFREAVEVFYNEGHGLPAYLYILVILAPVQFLSLAIPALDVQMWTGSANLFKVCSITALLLMVYFAMRVANQEFAPWRFQPMRRWLREEKLPAGSVGRAQLAFLSLHLFVSMLVCAPLLMWAGAIARTELITVLVTLLLLLFYSLSYGVWGLVTLALWERKAENRQVLVRCFFFSVAIVSALIYLPLNPVAYVLSYLGREELASLTIGGLNWSATSVHFGFHLALLGAGLATYLWALKHGGTA
jgi:hypothetical protein